MNTPRLIKIFLASSIVELKNERKELADYINNMVAPILAKGGIDVHLFKCEDDTLGNFGGSSQKMFDEELEASDVSVFLFKTKAGEATIHEFDLVRELQNEKRHGIYVYFFNVPEDEKSQELKVFQQRLMREKFYWKTCEDINSLKSLFLPGLLKQLFGEQEVSDVDWKSDTEKDIDSRLKQFEENKEIQAKLREKQTKLQVELHQDIDGLLQQIKAIMADKGKNIAVRIAKAIELYQKADNIADATVYDNEKYSDLLFNYANFLVDYGFNDDADQIFQRITLMKV